MTAVVTEAKGTPLQETRDPRAADSSPTTEPGRPANNRGEEPDPDLGGAVRRENAAEEPASVEGAPEPVAADADVDYKDRWLRAEAELQNFRRRARRELEESRRASEEAVLLDLLALLDDLERAHRAAGDTGAPAPWSEGVALVLQKGRDYLERQGVVTVDPAGQPFDPRFHEAILEMDAPEDVAPGTVMQVVHRGYRRGERALRPARVVVARAPADEA